MPKSKKRRTGKPQGLNLAQTKTVEKQIRNEAIRAEALALFRQHSDNLLQQAVDAAFIAAAEVFHMGPGRCEAFGGAVLDALHEIAGLVNADYEDDRELTYSRAKIDQRLQVICGEHFQPWEVRYGRREGMTEMEEDHETD